jgi:hypothetical protein
MIEYIPLLLVFPSLAQLNLVFGTVVDLLFDKLDSGLLLLNKAVLEVGRLGRRVATLHVLINILRRLANA